MDCEIWKSDAFFCLISRVYNFKCKGRIKTYSNAYVKSYISYDQCEFCKLSSMRDWKQPLRSVPWNRYSWKIYEIYEKYLWKSSFFSLFVCSEPSTYQKRNPFTYIIKDVPKTLQSFSLYFFLRNWRNSLRHCFHKMELFDNFFNGF